MIAVLRTAARGLALTALVVAMVAVRVVWSSHTELRLADERAAAGDSTMALDHFGRAARLYAPGNPFSTRALDELWARCQVAAGGDVTAMQAALSACREVRSAILSTRSVYTPSRDRLEGANQSIAILSARLESPSVDPGADEAARTRWHAERLARDEAPRVGWSIVALLGAATWIGCGFGFFLRGLDERDRPRRPAGWLWAAGIVGGFVLFVVGLGRA